jgi:hypothetical protein
MKKKSSFGLVVVLLVMSLLVFAGCGGADPASGDETTTTAGTATSSTDTTTAATNGGGSGKSDTVFEPHELLSAEEASAITGFAVTLDDGSLYKDEASGMISERYAYDLGDTGIHALVEVRQDGLKKSEGTVKDVFLFEKDLNKDEIAPVTGLGDDAFTMSQGQLHLLYGSYYIVVAFDADPYETTGNAALNAKIGTKILENLKARLG